MGENQIKEIIHAAACSVLFIDESQRVTLSDIGSVAEIEKLGGPWKNQKLLKCNLFLSSVVMVLMDTWHG